MNIYFLFLAFFVVALMKLGAAITEKSWGGMVYFYNDDGGRFPAAIHSSFDYSHLSGHALHLKSQERLVSAAQTILNTDGAGIRLGHFVTVDGNHKKKFACSVYNKVVLELASDDITVNGSPSKMLVESSCENGNDLSTIAPLWIPMKELTQKAPNKIGADSFTIYTFDGSPTSYTFSNMGHSWPKSWYLTSIRLTSETHNELYIDYPTYRKLLKKHNKTPIAFHWKP